MEDFERREMTPTSPMMFLAYENTATSPQYPSVFELIMQGKMSTTLKPAVEYAVAALCDSYPRLASLSVFQHMDETFALLMLFIERYQLRCYDALLIEKFFGMKRMKYDSLNNKLLPLEARDRSFTIFFSVILPYLKEKLDLKYKNEIGDRLENQIDHPNPVGTRETTIFPFSCSGLMHWFRQTSFKSAFVAIYPYFHSFYESYFLCYQWMYLMGKTRYFSPFLRRMNLVLCRVTPDDLKNFSQKELLRRKDRIRQLVGINWLNRIRRFYLRLLWAGIDHSHLMMILGIVAFRFLEWWYSSTSSPRLDLRNAPIPPPPEISKRALEGIPLPSNTKVCPLCSKKRTNPATCLSGYVFCYPCIFKYVSDFGRCPITHLGCKSSTIRRLFEDKVE